MELVKHVDQRPTFWRKRRLNCIPIVSSEKRADHSRILMRAVKRLSSLAFFRQPEVPVAKTGFVTLMCLFIHLQLAWFIHSLHGRGKQSQLLRSLYLLPARMPTLGLPEDVFLVFRIYDSKTTVKVISSSRLNLGRSKSLCLQGRKEWANRRIT